MVAATSLMALAPAAAHAATRSVTMGEPASAVSTFEQKYSGDANAFFPERVTIHPGDSVKFIPVGFHTVDIPAKGQKPAPLVLPAGTISGIKDAAGSDFWFNGQADLQFNPALLANLYGQSVTYDPSKGVETGLPVIPNPQPVTVKFDKAGTYTYFCNVHPGMKATVAVVKNKRRIPSAKKVAKTVKQQVRRDLKILKGLSKRSIAANTVSVGNAGPHGVDWYGMLPGTLNVKVGQTVTFRMAPKSREDHTATFGPGNPNDATSYIGQIAASFQGASLDQRGVYPSDATTATLSPTLHGNGFWNTGVMDASSATPLPSSGKVTFGAAGTYDYYCLIHPFMHGVINVQ